MIFEYHQFLFQFWKRICLLSRNISYNLVRDGFRAQLPLQWGHILSSRGILSYLPASTRRLWQPILSFTRVLLKGFLRVEFRYVSELIAQLEFVNHCEMVYNSIDFDSWVVTCRVFLEFRARMYLARFLIACRRDYSPATRNCMATYLVDSAVSWGEGDNRWPIYVASEQGNVSRQISKYTRRDASDSRVQQRTKLLEGQLKMTY